MKRLTTFGLGICLLVTGSTVYAKRTHLVVREGTPCQETEVCYVTRSSLGWDGVKEAKGKATWGDRLLWGAPTPLPERKGDLAVKRAVRQ